jgi:hypothetical protein
VTEHGEAEHLAAYLLRDIAPVLVAHAGMARQPFPRGREAVKEGRQAGREWHPAEGSGYGTGSASIGGGAGAGCGPADHRRRARTETWWHPSGLSSRQPGQHVDPRGSDQLGVDSDDGGIQQPRALRSARGAKPPRYDPARSRRELVVERGWHAAHVQTARGRQMARRKAVHRRGRQMHLGPVDRPSVRQVARQSTQVMVEQRRGGRH